MQVLDFSKRFTLKLAAVVGLPVILLASLVLLSEDHTVAEELAYKAAAVKSYYNTTPPRPSWELTDVRVTDDERVVADVNVPVIREADVIRTRSGRIKYSYLKLACPPVGAPILEAMDGDLLYINLHFKGESFMEAACPKDGRIGFFQG